MGEEPRKYIKYVNFLTYRPQSLKSTLEIILQRLMSWLKVFSWIKISSIGSIQAIFQKSP